jgi:purine nucleoside phosphorylase
MHKMSEFIELNQIDEAAQVVRERIDIHPRVGMILGSGLGSLAGNPECAHHAG